MTRGSILTSLKRAVFAVGVAALIWMVFPYGQQFHPAQHNLDAQNVAASQQAEHVFLTPSGLNLSAGSASADAVETVKANLAAWGPAQLPIGTPANLPPVIAGDPIDGVWQPTSIVVRGSSAVYLARVRNTDAPNLNYTSVAWFDTNLLAFGQVPGTVMPEAHFDHGTGMVSQNLRQFYVAGFANGYKMNQSQGGYFKDGKTYVKMVPGKATLLTYPNGSLRLVVWGRSPVPPGYAVARQNLKPIVDNGVAMIQTENQQKWGTTWHGLGKGKNYVWRSGLGVRSDGSLVYVQGDWLSGRGLAALLARAGAVTAMALDMNSGFANGYLYGPYLPHPKLINPNNPNDPMSFYKPSERDFVAVFARSSATGK